MDYPPDPPVDTLGSHAGPELPFAGTLEKRSEHLGFWQPRRVQIDRGSFQYFKDGHREPRLSLGAGDVLQVDVDLPDVILLRARLSAGQARTFELRAASEEELWHWVRLIQAAFVIPRLLPATGSTRSMTDSNPLTAGGPHSEPTLPHTGTLEKRAEKLGCWQPRRVHVDRGSFQYFKDGCREPRLSLGTGDVLHVDADLPDILLLRARLSGGQERTFELRAPSEEELWHWVQLIQVAFEITPGHLLPPIPSRSSLSIAESFLPSSSGELGLPYVGVLEKRSELLGLWQPRRVHVDRGSFRYFKDGCREPRLSLGAGDILHVDADPPDIVLVRARLSGGQERTFELRAPSEDELWHWVELIQVAYDITTGPSLSGVPGSSTILADSQSSNASGKWLKRMATVGSTIGHHASHAVGKVAKVTRTEQWLDGAREAARRSAARFREHIERQMEEALTRCDDRTIDMILDTALERGLSNERLPTAIRQAARRIAGRNLRDATAAGDPRRLKGALVAAKRLQATDVPEFEPAVNMYKEVRRLPEGWDVAKMLEQRQRGGKLLTKPDVSQNAGLVALVQLIVDRTFRRVYTRDRNGSPVPEQLRVVHVAEVQNEAQWFDYLTRREAVKWELRSRAQVGQDVPSDFFLVNAETEQPLREAAATAAGENVSATVPPEAKPGDLVEVRNPLSEQPVRIQLTADQPPGSKVWLQASLATALPGPALETAANEAWLFHGTKPIAADSITSHDFRIDLAGSSKGSLYGRGIYLAENSSKADEYSSADRKTGLFTMLLCRVTLGQLLYNDAVTPDPRRCEEACLKGEYHAVLGDRKACRGTFREFAVFDEDQIYPSYIVSYKRL